MQRLTLFKLGALIVIAILALALGAGRWSNFVPFVGLTVAALFVFRRRHGSQTAYRTPGYPVTPMIFLVLVAVLLTLLAGQAPL
jgi:hypothetical protein